MDQMEKVIGAEGAPLTTVACFVETVDFMMDVLRKNLRELRVSLQEGKSSQLIEYHTKGREYVVHMDFIIGMMSIRDVKSKLTLFTVMFDKSILQPGNAPWASNL